MEKPTPQQLAAMPLHQLYETLVNFHTFHDIENIESIDDIDAILNLEKDKLEIEKWKNTRIKIVELIKSQRKATYNLMARKGLNTQWMDNLPEIPN